MIGIRSKRTDGRGRDRELHRLSRKDLLELLVQQMHEDDELHLAIERGEHDATEQAALVARLKEKLDDKDAKIAHLQGRLDDKDAKIARLKRRLDAKDALIARIAEASGMDPMTIAVLETKQRSEEATEATGGGGEEHE